jgi:protein-S-isoprenylcysteine O-methyltransferase Ste14
MSDRDRQNRLLIRAIMGGVLVWGLVLALGAALHSAGIWNFDPRRGLIVFACVLAFLGFWILMLRSRARQDQTKRSE